MNVFRLKSIFFVLITSLLPSLVGLVTSPIILKNAGIEKLGYLTIIWSITGFFSLFEFGISKSITYYISKFKDDYFLRSKFFSCGFFLLLLLSVFIVLVGFIILFIVSGFTSLLTNELIISIVVVIITIPVVINSNVFKSVLEGDMRFALVSSIRLPTGIFLFLVPLILSYKYTELYIFCLGILVVRIISCTFYYVMSSGVVHFNYKFVTKSECKTILRFGGWLTVSNTIVPILTQIDRYFLLASTGVIGVSYYTTTQDALSRSLIIPSSIVSVIFPYFSREDNEEEKKKILIKSVLAVSFIFFALTIFFYFYAKEILTLWMGADFASQSYIYSIYIMLCMTINAIGYVPYNYIQSFDRTDITAKLHLIQIVFYLPILFVLIKIYGIWGAIASWILRIVFDTLSLLYICFFQKRLFGKDS